MFSICRKSGRRRWSLRRINSRGRSQTLILAAGALAVAWTAPPAAGQCDPRWAQRFDVPAARLEPAMARDERRGVVLLFGGHADLATTDDPAFRQLWEWDGLKWNHRADVAAPPGRVNLVEMAYDSWRGVMVLRRQQYQRLPETWEFDGQTWSLRVAGGPPTLGREAMTYDSRRGVTVLWGERGLGTWEWDGDTWMYRGPGPPAFDALFELAFDENRGVTVAFGNANSQAETWEWDGATWTLRAVGGPPNRFGHALAYDAVRRETLLYGGGLGVRLAETWAWDGQSWRFVTEGQPTARAGHGLAYDATRGRLVVFGGTPEADGYLSDTWTFDGDTWTLADEGGPAARLGHALAYDSNRDRLVLFGGITGSDGYSIAGDTWEHDGARWQRVATTGPPARLGHVMAYDSARGVTVLFSGYGWGDPMGDTWEWDGQAWALRAISGPAPRWLAQMSYDAGRRVCVLFGGGDNDQHNYERMRDTWEWDGTTWTLRATSGPPGRSQFGMCYDSVRGVTMLFAGIDVPAPGDFIYHRDTWAWDGAIWTQLASSGPPARYEHVMGFDDVRGVAVVFSGLAAPNRTLSDAWEWDGNMWWEVRAEPSGRPLSAMAYVVTRQAVTLFGGGESPGFRSDQWDLASRPIGPGDVNCDCVTNAFDIEPFVLAVFDPVEYANRYPDCDITLADVNQDGVINAFDIEPFIGLLFGP